jgi:VIT1/CCC1 family predicted Fe2+/Mn2+ transporter
MKRGVAGLVAGAMSMAAGEYVSVSSQSDTEGWPSIDCTALA